MKLAEVVALYHAFLKEETTKATTTVRDYHRAARQVTDWLGHELGHEPVLKDLTPAKVRKYFAAFCLNHRPRSYNARLYGVKHWCKWMTEEGYLASDPSGTVETMELDQAFRPVPDDEKCRKFIEACELIGDPYKCALYRACAALYIYHGLRFSESIALCIEDVDLKDGKLCIRKSKGRKNRVIFLNESSGTALATYLSVRPEDSFDNYLFRHHRRYRVGVQGMRDIIRDVKALAGMKGDPALNPHGIRHAVTNRLLERRENLRVIQDMMGWQSIQTIDHYAQVNDEQRKRAAARTELTTPPSKQKQGPAGSEQAPRFAIQRRPHR